MKVSVATLITTETSKQTVEVKFEGELVGSYTDKDTTCTLYSVAEDLPAWGTLMSGDESCLRMKRSWQPQRRIQRRHSCSARENERVLPHDKADELTSIHLLH